MIHRSPLRYPGGKTQLTEFLSHLIDSQQPRPRIYAEPFAGGAGAACALMLGFHVDRILINDLNPGLAAFWRCVSERGPELIHQVQTTPVTIGEWHRQHELFESNESGDDIELGFATFFLNRTNRSGILDARPIGGLSQTGKWKLDARWNTEALVKRLRLLSLYGSRIDVTELHAVDFLKTIRQRDDVLVYADPPYLTHGPDLYLDRLTLDDHRSVADELQRHHKRWMVTYDHDARVMTDLYPSETAGEFDLAHTAAVQHVGQELVVFSPELNVSDVEMINKGRGRRLRTKAAA